MTDSHHRVRFAHFAANLSSGEVFRNGVRLPVQEKPFQILRVLLQAQGATVSREQMYAAVWPDTYVERALSLNTAVRKLRAALGDDARNPQLIETVENGYRLLVEPQFLPSAARGEPRHKIRLAVIPFENLGSEEQEYLADGMTEEMIAQLGRTHKELSIIAPFSTLLYRRSSKPIEVIAHDLRADYVLAGSVRGSEGGLQVTAKVIRTEDQAEIWSESYARAQGDMLVIQDEITTHIAGAIMTVLHVADSRAKSLSTDRWTHEKYLKGCFFANKWSEPGFRKAIELFQQTIEDDPGFAPAHAALAKLYMGMGAQGILPPSVLNDLTRTAAGKALSLCPDLADAITALGWSLLFHDGNWRAAERSFLRSIEINPSATHAYEGYSHLLVAVGRFDEAIEIARCACELDPLSPFSANLLSCTLYFSGYFEEARIQILRCLEANPGFPISYATLGWICEALGEMTHSVAAHRAAVQHNGDNPAMLANLAHALGVAGHQGEAEEILQRAVTARQNIYVPPYWIALGYAGIHQPEAALDWLETGIDEHCGWRVFYGVDPKLQNLRSMDRFRTILDRVGFPQSTGPAIRRT